VLFGLACAALACAHEAPRALTTGAAPHPNGLDAVRAWTSVLYPYGEAAFDRRTWWIGPTARAELAQLAVPIASMPVEVLEDYGPGRPSGAPHRTDKLVLELADRAAHRFAKLIWRASAERVWREAADGIRNDRAGIGVSAEVHNLCARSFPYPPRLYERLAGERQDRPPAIEELGAALLFGAASEERSIYDRGKIDPGMVMHTPLEQCADAPLTLAPLYALSAGVDPSAVREAALELFGMLGKTQHDARVLVQSIRGYGL
jgi:hypothetical protein